MDQGKQKTVQLIVKVCELQVMDQGKQKTILIIIKVRELQVMNQGKQRTRSKSKIQSYYLKRKEKRHEKKSKKGIKQIFCSINKSAKNQRKISK
jgi:hypothetical protein